MALNGLLCADVTLRTYTLTLNQSIKALTINQSKHTDTSTAM